MFGYQRQGLTVVHRQMTKVVPVRMTSRARHSPFPLRVVAARCGSIQWNRSSRDNCKPQTSIWGLSKLGKTCKSCGLSVHTKCELRVGQIIPHSSPVCECLQGTRGMYRCSRRSQSHGDTLQDLIDNIPQGNRPRSGGFCRKTQLYPFLRN